LVSVCCAFGLIIPCCSGGQAGRCSGFSASGFAVSC
jgi:hypothetical protein